MGTQAPLAFGELLREYRLAAGLTQEALAERAGVSVRAVQNLERGEHRPFKDTAQRLAEALGLGERQRALLLAAAISTSRRRGSTPARAAGSAGIAERAPAPSPGARHNLPAALSSFIGRERERREVHHLLERARLVTLIGAGGVGKTRLALTVAEDLVEGYRDGVWLVELAALAGTTAGGAPLVPGAVAQALGVREEPRRPLLETLAGHLRDRQLLLVLDNCEHLVEACAALAALLRACPKVAILATSREALGVAGERRFRVPSLSVPDPRHLPAIELAASYEAVRLFVQRAQEHRPDFALTEGNARAVVEVCARLDGIPLAIELAAARVGSLSVEDIAARLDDRFRLLTGGSRDALPRQRTLRATLHWSYDLLTEGEQALVDRLSVFAGGWTLAAAEAVCADAGLEEEQPRSEDGLPREKEGRQRGPVGKVGRWEVLDLLGGLVGKSLVLAEEAGGEVRYGLLETVRQYGGERLAAAGGAEVVRDRHLAWYLALAEEAAPGLWGAAQANWLARLEAEHDNLRAALRWARERGAAEEGLRLAGALGRFWAMRGYLGEALSWLEGALAGGTGGAAVRARALDQAGDLAAWQGDFARGAALLEESLALHRALGDAAGVALALNHLATAVERLGDYARATILLEEGLALYRALGDPVGIANSLHDLGWVASLRGEYERAVALYEESVARYREAGFDEGVARSLCDLASVMDWRGAYERAVALQEEALALWRGVGNPAGSAWVLMNLGWSLLALGEEERATARLEEGLALARETGYFWGIPYALACLGWAAYLRGEDERAATLQEQALARYRQVNYRWGVLRLLTSLGCVVQARGEYGRAATYLREALALGREIGAQGRLAEALEGMAWLAAAEGQTARAARLGGAAEALREGLGAALHAVLRAGHERAVRAMRDALGEAAFTAAWAEGRALPLEEAVALALEDTDAVPHGQ